ncbi:MAG: NYN domain-containing protein [Chloroflexota bacterium]
MIYLVDGHNLIGKLPDIQLSDPDDEQQLVRKLSAWVQRDYRRKIRVFFDSGEFGGLGNSLSAPTVRVQFSRVGQTADSVIIRFMEGVKNPQEFTLVTSDREIIFAARKKRIGYILSEEFAVLMAENLQENGEVETADTKEEGTEEEVDVSDAEIQTWMNAFKNAPHRSPDVHIVHLPKKPTNLEASNDPKALRQQKEAAKQENVDKLKDGESALSQDDLKEWMELFGDEVVRQKKQDERPIVVPDPSKKRKTTTRRKKDDPVVRKFAEEGLNEEEINTWLDLFQENKGKTKK